MAIRQTHFLDLDLASGELIFAQDDSEGDTALFGGFELLGELWFRFV